MSLPIHQHQHQLVDAILRSQFTILSSPTGSGKSTQLPQFLLAHTKKRITVTQPRRVAAISLAERVAFEMNVKIGTQVGFSVRFQDQTDKSTKIRYATDGVVVREALRGSFLTDDFLIIDEAHERSVQTDILLGLAKLWGQQNAKLKIIIMSATLNCQEFANFFETENILHIQGRTYPIRHLFLEQPERNYIEATALAIYQIIQSQSQQIKGDILTFMPGEREIETVVSTLKIYLQNDPKIEILPLFSSLPQEQQMRIFSPKPENIEIRVIVATNVAETSITVPCISFVVDSGLVRQKIYDPNSGLSRLITIPAAKSQLQQRAGRAGRISAGQVFHLYTFESFSELKNAQIPEILRSDLSDVFLTLLAAGISKIQEFQVPQQPQQISKKRALARLFKLGIVETGPEIGAFQLSTLGLQCAKLPLAVDQAVCVISSLQYNENVLRKTVKLVAVLQVVESIFSGETKKLRANFESALGDHITLVNVFEEWEAVKNRKEFCVKYGVSDRSMQFARSVFDQIMAIITANFTICSVSVEDENEVVLRCVLKGFVENVAMSVEGTQQYSTRGLTAKLHPGGGFRGSELVVYNEAVQTSDVYLRVVSGVKEAWLE
ncbi:Pre-mRNA-splicing factor ATP-dependent RNA helicase [Spironucleus salmonicida]|uniref:Pre-mRNA-splicing factor ATP-dependent RNA helicase n=1 Tax=Spironucleus salmonicida TaxID=348837 RepID=V6LL93_9EUKA|nr:Pre-mRNA-splicing factor ATP-dependent RNA helicase [Spironucleus salmonicida]|eukprot:EST44506.1 Pre-mRNA-splicing factor ATP-dependent RNA helicase [Spironucleus salmonicida]